MDMMFNTEMIVKDMKGGKEDMTEKQYYQRDFEELYYIIDSNVISEKEFDEKEMYDGYTAFEDSMTGKEIVGLLNEQHEQIERLKQNFRALDEVKCELADENEQLKTENTMLKEHQNINCQNCQYFVSDSVSSDCLKREDISYKGTCIDGMDLHMLAKNCPYY